MLAPERKGAFLPKPYLSAAAQFAASNDTPRDLLERCLAAITEFEPQVGAFGAALRSSPAWQYVVDPAAFLSGDAEPDNDE